MKLQGLLVLLACWLILALGGCGSSSDPSDAGPLGPLADCQVVGPCPAVKIVQQPADVSVRHDEQVHFAIVVESRADNPVAATWERCAPVADPAACVWVNVSGGTFTASFDMNFKASYPADDGARFRVQILAQDGQQRVSRAALLRVASTRPVITQQPQDAVATIGGQPIFTVDSSNPYPLPLSFQWQISRDGGANFTEVPVTFGDLHTNRLGWPPVVANDDGAMVRVIVTNQAGSTTSQTARLTVVAAAGPVSFGDDTFADSDWSLFVYFGGNGGVVQAAQVTAGGQPGAYRSIKHQVNAAPDTDTTSRVFSLHFKSGALYDPAASGAITAIDYAQQSHLISTGGSQQATSLALRQAGQTYYATSAYQAIAEADWATKGKTGLVAADFVALMADTSETAQHPDFSGTGQPIQFGFLRANSTSFGGGGYTVETGIDNWSVVVRRAP